MSNIGKCVAILGRGQKPVIVNKYTEEFYVISILLTTAGGFLSTGGAYRGHGLVVLAGRLLLELLALDWAETRRNKQ